MLKLSRNNSKIKETGKMLNLRPKEIISLDLPAGYTCPKADICLAKADQETGKITKGKNCKFKCYATKAEAHYPNVRRARWHNLNLIRRAKSCQQVKTLLDQSIPDFTKAIRVHSSGDFFNKRYFMGWVLFALARPNVILFGYTKILDYVLFDRPDNFSLVYSLGGKDDSRASMFEVPKCQVAASPEQALYPIACQDNKMDDYIRIINKESFTILVH